MKEIRPLNKKEFEDLLLNAPEIEIAFIVQAAEEVGEHVYDFMQNRALEQSALIIDKIPLYMGFLTRHIDGRYELWTVVRADVKQQKTLYKEVRKYADKWTAKYGTIYATMHTGNQKNINWTERMGFNEVYRYNGQVTFKKER